MLAAALDEFAAKGYAGARVQDIADRAGVNKQLITYDFGGKDGLYRALAQSWLDQEAAFAGPDVPIETLVGEYVRATLTDPRLTRLLIWDGLTGHGRDAPESISASRQTWRTCAGGRQPESSLPTSIQPCSCLP